jgi:DNA-binding MarR family transcriptional regulator
MAARKRQGRGKQKALVGVESGSARGQAVPFDHTQHLFYWLTQVISRRDRHLTEALRPHGVRVPEWRVVGLLYSRRGLSMTEVADAAAIDPTTLSRTVAELVRAGLIVRLSPVGDKRVTRLALTAAGTRLAEQILPIVFRLNEIACAGLPESVPGLMRWALGEMRRNLDAHLTDEAPTAAAAED